MADEQQPFADVRLHDDGFSIPELKWRELLFVGALEREPSGVYRRDPSRRLPSFRIVELFPDDGRFDVRNEGGRVRLRRVG